MPGLVDSHMHTGQQLLKGLVLDAKPIIWTRVMLPFESTLTPEKMRLSAQAAALEMIKSGTAGFIDAGSYFMEDAAAVYETSGLRGALSYSTMDEEGLPESIAMDANEAVRRTDSGTSRYSASGPDRPRAAYWAARSAAAAGRYPAMSALLRGTVDLVGRRVQRQGDPIVRPRGQVGRVSQGDLVDPLLARGQQGSAMEHGIRKIAQDAGMGGFRCVGLHRPFPGLRHDEALPAGEAEGPLGLRQLPKTQPAVLDQQFTPIPLISNRLVPGHSPVLVIKAAVAPLSYSA